MSKRKKNVDSLLAVTADYSANAAWYEITEARSHIMPLSARTREK